MSWVAWLSRKLEAQGTPSPVFDLASRAYEHLATPYLQRRVVLPDAIVVGVGGAVLGGAGKTPVAIEYARALALSGRSVALVGHAYGARPRHTRRVQPGDGVNEVGDDALVAADALQGSSVGVWVGARRHQLLAESAKLAEVLVVDGLLQTRPKRVYRSVLVVDARRPFGSGHCPPVGDLRGAADQLVALCDEMVLVSDPLMAATGAQDALISGVADKPIRRGWISLLGARDNEGRSLSLEELATAKLGLLLTEARPGRVVASLQARGIRPCCVVAGADHRTPSPREMAQIRGLRARHGLDGWLLTPKSRPHIAEDAVGGPIWTLLVSTRLDPTPQLMLDSPPCIRHDFSSP